MVYTVRIQSDPKDEKRYADEQKERTEQLDISREQTSSAKALNIISGIGGGIAFLALVALIYNAILVHRQWKAMLDANTISKTAADLAYRPYIGVDQIEVRFYRGEADRTGTINPTAQTTEMGITVQIKNFGPVPGTNCVSEWHVFVGDTEIPHTKVADRPATFFPGQLLSLGAILTPLGYKVVSRGEKPLTVSVKVSYDGPTGHTEECERAQYLPQASRFGKLGCPAN
jgi:hypothetical protein